MYKCAICGREFDKFQSLAAHMVTHNDKFIVCNLCGKKIKSQNVKKHLESHKKDSNCLFCGGRISGNRKFCNHSCSASYSNKNRGKKIHKLYSCKGCKNQIKYGQYCSVKCKKESEYKEYIQRWINGQETGNIKSESVSSHVRRWLVDRSGNKCEAMLDDGTRCNWSRINVHTGRIPLTVHHKDGNSNNTVQSNVELVCPNCHSLTPTYGALNKGRGRKVRSQKRHLRL